MFRFHSVVLTAMALMFLVAPAMALDDVISTIYLDDGTTISGKIIKDHVDSIIMTVEGKNLSVDKVKIKRIAREDNYQPTLTKGYELESSGKFGEAIEQYHKILIQDPEHKDAAEGKARMMQAIPYEFKKRHVQFFQAQAFDKILQLIYNEASGLPADSPQREAMKSVESEIYTFTGQDKMKRLMYEQAEQDFRRAIRLNPKNFTAALMLGDLFTATARWTDAYNILRDVILEYPDNLIANGLLMQAAFHTGHSEHGLQLLDTLNTWNNPSQQEQRFIAMCLNDCKDLIAKAQGSPPGPTSDDTGTSPSEQAAPTGSATPAP